MPGSVVRPEDAHRDTHERRMPGPLYAQEYGCQFLDIVRAVFRHEDVARAITDEVRPLFDLSKVA